MYNKITAFAVHAANSLEQTGPELRTQTAKTFFCLWTEQNEKVYDIFAPKHVSVENDGSDWILARLRGSSSHNYSSILHG